MEESKNNSSELVQISENVFFSCKIKGFIINGNEVPLTKIPYKVMKCLVDEKGSVVTIDRILDNVWGNDVFEFEDPAHLVTDTIKRLRVVLGKYKKIIKTHRGLGYSVENNGNNSNESCQKDSKRLPAILTKSIVPNTVANTVINRNTEIDDMELLLKEKKTKSILICGFAGVGKTSLARLLYSTIKDEYDCVGWVDYHVDLKNSMVEALDLKNIIGQDSYEDGGFEIKWSCLSYLLKNSPEKKLLVIDNVDYDDEINQNPMTDNILIGISGWKNLDIVLTSRIPEIKGYVSYNVDNLGNADDYCACVNLFYHYNRVAAINRSVNQSIVESIVKLAGYNTMVIELLAKSCLYEKSIKSYYDRLVEVGFEYPDVPVLTMHNNDAEIAIKQIVKLFELKKRNDVERLILIEFRLLDEGEKVSKAELIQWLGAKVKDIDSLAKEGWIKFDNGNFYIHPLVRKSIRFDNDLKEEYVSLLEKYRLIYGKGLPILYSVSEKSLFDKLDFYELGIRKLRFADCLSLNGEWFAPDVKVYVADYARKIGKKDVAQKYYRMAYEDLCDGEINNELIENSSVKNLDFEHLYLVWKVTYFYSYMLSYTKSGLQIAEHIIKKALDIANFLYKHKNNSHNLMILAATNDHLAYILFNEYCDEENMIEAYEYLSAAITQRLFLCELYPDDKRFLHDLSWSQDNMGCLLAKIDKNVFDKPECQDKNYKNYSLVVKMLCELSDAEKYLRDSLKKREELAKGGQVNYLKEVAWTRCNLASCIAKDSLRAEEAEEMLKKALETYETIENNFIGYEVSSKARTYATYADMLTQVGGRKEDAINNYKKALDVNNRLEEATLGDYIQEIELIKKKMLYLEDDEVD